MLAALSQSKVDTPCHKCFHFCLLEYRYIGSYGIGASGTEYRVPSTDTTGYRHPAVVSPGFSAFSSTERHFL